MDSAELAQITGENMLELSVAQDQKKYYRQNCSMKNWQNKDYEKRHKNAPKYHVKRHAKVKIAVKNEIG